MLSIGNGDVRNNITSIGPFTYDGQDGYDTFNVLNSAGTETMRDAREQTFFRIGNTALTYAFRVQDPNVELTDLSAGGGSGAEIMEVLAMRSGTEFRVDMGPGTDVLRLGFSGILPSTNTVDGIDGVIRYTASASGGRIDLEDSADTTGDTFHQNRTSVGALPGDNLFGPGGSLQFSGIIDFGACIAGPAHQPGQRRRYDFC